jgi:hypothetical protein
VLHAISWVLARRQAIANSRDIGAIEIGDTACERSMRTPVLARNNRLFAGSIFGGKAIASWLSMIQSARLFEAERSAY